ncbi:tryptophan halogenase family protein [Gayadomonas joobiniege]|uniref:tryptophan halogenase family protein n=1 Tax=Gayadomonas joobiniege TaxID=1234606 RepID=UPI00035F7F30|nr:tryptophan halogenase family protein [Gayadomonas joobiniege]
MVTKIKNITIVGGGTAGWLTAGILAARLRTRIQQGDLTITLCESPNVPIIGVGEGTWPTMPASLKSMGIAESDFIKACDASFKQGSKFVHWGCDDEQKSDFYYHPFDVPVAAMEGLLPEYWLQHPSLGPIADAFSVQQALCEANLAPKLITDGEYKKIANYGYHLDAGKFAEFLKNHCMQKLAVKHQLADVVDVNLDQQGFIQSLRLADQADLEADFFIDCTGFKSILLGQALAVPFKPAKDILFADTAIATQVPYHSDSAEIKPYTQSTAQEAGWVWDIGLPTRRGVGYVFASQYSSEAQAKQVLANYIKSTGGDPARLNYRTINFTAGHREKFWAKNCVAVGLSAGFLEPLEASALVMVELSAMMIAEQLPAVRETLHIAEQRFNQKFAYRWQRAIDFLKLHYLLSQRQSPFWQANRQQSSVPESLQALMQLWRYQVPKVSDFEATGELFQAASFQFVLYGSGFKTDLMVHLSAAEKEFMQHQALKNKHNVDNLLKQVPSNRDLINKIRQYGLTKS